MDAADPNYERAGACLPALTGDLLVTHNYVVVESAALVQRRLGTQAVRDLLTRQLAPVDVMWVDADLHDSAVSALLASDRRGVSLVDRVSFELMRRLRIDTAFAFDDDFEREGFALVLGKR